MSQPALIDEPENAIDIKPVRTADERKTFIRVTNDIYKDDPHFVAPLEFELSPRIDPDKNPLLKSARHQLWVAFKDGKPVGRISALINPDHLARHQDGTGHFGFYESIDDPAVATLIFGAAETWLREQGMKHIAGPYSFSVNEECGMLVKGFDAPPYIMMPHGRPYYQSQIEALGYAKAQDMHALRYIPRRQFIPERRQKFIEKIVNKPHIEVRNMRPGGLEDDLRIIIDIFNDAWSDNWGFIPFTEDHAKHMASELRPIIRRDYIVICSINDEPMAFGLVLPNINEVIAGFGGKLLPFNWVQFLWKLKVSGIKSSRMPLMGVRKSIQGKPTGAAFAYKIIDMVNSTNIDRGVTEAELSWILEDNEAMLSMLLDMGGEIYKTNRIYKKAL
ncbi:MAG: hypothetical protein AAGB02_09275 [Pseudomonadota bacterium]